MTTYITANNVNTQLAAAASSSATTLTLASSSNLPTLSAGQVMPLTLNDASTGLVYEVVYVTAISGVTLTVTRAQEGTTAQNWNIGDFAFCAPTAGTVATALGNPANTFQVGAATQSNHAAQFGQLSGLIGAMRNASMKVSTASASATFTADQIIVGTALNGLQYALPSYSQAINLGTTGAGGMDTGSAPVSGYVALYAIYNPATATASILAVNATSAAAPTIYGGAHMPAGYTASALISVWPTNSSGYFVTGNQFDRSLKRAAVTALSTTTQESTPTSFALTSCVPLNAKTCGGTINLSNTNASTGNNGTISSDANASGQKTLAIYIATAGGAGSMSVDDIQIVTAQTLYYTLYTNSGTITYTLTINGYTF